MTERRQTPPDELLISLYSKIENLESKIPEKSWTDNLSAIFGAVSTAAIIALFTFTYNSNASTVALQTQVKQMQDQIVTLTSKIESMQQSYVDKADFNSLDARVRVLEINSGTRFRR